jgi:hypothetical protein
MQEIVKQMTTRTKWIALAVCVAVLFWSPLVVHTFKRDSI